MFLRKMELVYKKKNDERERDGPKLYFVPRHSGTFWTKVCKHLKNRDGKISPNPTPYILGKFFTETLKRLQRG